MAIGTVEILGVRVDCVDFVQTLTIIQGWIDNAVDPPQVATVKGDDTGHRGDTVQGRDTGQGGTRQLCTVNPEFVMQARIDPVFATALRQADLCVPDGGGLLWAARRQGVRLRERVTGSDGIYRICERAAEAGWTVFLLGAAPGVAATAAAKLQARYPGLQVAGTYSGSPAEGDWLIIREQLQRTQPDILFVAYGHPRQDLWIARHRAELPVKVALGVGAAFDFVAGVVRRAPLWMQRLGLEWLHRLITQPWRWRRMLALPHFVWLVLRANTQRPK